MIDDSIERLLPGHYGQILKMLRSWAGRTQSPAMPEGAVPAVRVAYRLLGMVRARSDDTRRILEIIAGVPRADSDRFLSLVERASSKSERQNIVLGKFRDILMAGSGFRRAGLSKGDGGVCTVIMHSRGAGHGQSLDIR